MLMPKKLAHRKPHRPDVTDGVATSGNYVAFGSFGLKAVTAAWVSAQQLEAARRVLAKYTHRGGKTWIRVFPHSAITAKGSQTTMGGGKGAPEKYIAAVRPGNIIFEIDGVPETEARQALTLAAYKLPVKAKIVKKQ
ncbi:MAG: 50S ribosomal protein L16 [Candidatus Buchananbacteria bacterium]